MGRCILSCVYDYFSYDKKINESVCKNCDGKIKGKHGTNLKRHLSSHQDLYEEMLVKDAEKKKSSTKINTSVIKAHEKLFYFSTPEVKVNINMETLIGACVDLVTVNGRPYSVLNDTGFKKIINPILDGMNKKVAINSNTIKKYVHEESLAIQKEIRFEAFTKAKLISLKLDAVTRLNRSFLGINIQYTVDDYIKLRTLGLVELTKSHTGLYLKEVILNVLKKYNIEPDQIYTITSDNGANMLKAVSLIEKDISDLQQSDEESASSSSGKSGEILLNDDDDNSVCSNETTSEICIENNVDLDEDQISMMLAENTEENTNCLDNDYEQTENILNEIQSFQNIGGDTSIFTGVRCVAHTLQLAVIDSLKDCGIEKILNKVRTLVKKLRNQTYIYIIKKEKLKSPILDCLTRWHSTLDMLERVKYLKHFIQNMAANDSSLKKVCLNNSEWNQIEVISKALLPSKICTKKFQNEQLTLTDFYGAWILCKIQTKKCNTSFSEKLVECLNNREQHLMKNKVLLAAIFLDPRYKIILDDEQYTIAINHLIRVWLQLKKLEQKSIDLTKNNDDIISNKDSEDDSTTDSDGLEDFLKEKDDVESYNVSKISQTSVSHTIETILKSYHIKQNRLNYKVNILKFWKSMENIYPEIYVLAKIILSVPSTQVSVERLFSGLKFIFSPYRCNINSQNLEDQLLVRTNRLFDKADSKYIKKSTEKHLTTNIEISSCQEETEDDTDSMGSRIKKPPTKKPRTKEPRINKPLI